MSVQTELYFEAPQRWISFYGKNQQLEGKLHYRQTDSRWSCQRQKSFKKSYQMELAIEEKFPEGVPKLGKEDIDLHDFPLHMECHIEILVRLELGHAKLCFLRFIDENDGHWIVAETGTFNPEYLKTQSEAALEVIQSEYPRARLVSMGLLPE